MQMVVRVLRRILVTEVVVVVFEVQVEGLLLHLHLTVHHLTVPRCVLQQAQLAQMSLFEQKSVLL